MTEEAHWSNDTEAALQHQEKGKGLSFERPLGPYLVPKEILRYFRALQLILEFGGRKAGRALSGRIW